MEFQPWSESTRNAEQEARALDRERRDHRIADDHRSTSDQAGTHSRIPQPQRRHWWQLWRPSL